MTNAPTAEFKRQHDVDAPRVDERSFRQGWIVRTRLDQLLADRRITRGEWQAAVEYRAAWAIARELAGIEPGMLRIAGSASADDATIARLDAVTKLRRVEDQIGSLAARLLLACLVHDLAWAVVARYVRKNPETVRDWTVLAIRALATSWGRSHEARSDAPSPARSVPREVHRRSDRPPTAENISRRASPARQERSVASWRSQAAARR